MRQGFRRPGRAIGYVALAAALTLIVGCGSSGGSSSSSKQTSAAQTNARGAVTTADTPPVAGAEFAKQRAIFRTRCGACHELEDAKVFGTKAGTSAPLDQIRSNRSTVLNYLTHKIGKMPDFSHSFSKREIHDLATYLATADGCGTERATACKEVRPRR